MIKYSRHPQKYPLEKRYNRLRKLTIFVFRHMHVDFKLKNIEYVNSQKGVFVIVSNHLSDLDPLALIALCEKPITFVAKQEVYHFPFIGRCVRMLEGVFLNRNDLRQEIRVMQQATDLLKRGYISVVIFPEGTRNKNPLDPVMDFKPGSLKIAYRANVPIIPLALYGTFRPLKAYLHLKKYPVSMHFFDVINPDEYQSIQTTELAPRLRDLIQKEIDRERLTEDAIIINHNKKEIESN
jgi:1-acyl-sn-glycerol-3-phosphate acyltransferase